MKENKYLQWLSGNTQSIYWHDSAVQKEQVTAFENGAVGMTTNPFLINSTLNSDRPFWEESLSRLQKDLQGDDKALALIQMVTGYYADALRPIYEKGIPGKGYVCAQTNPLHTGEEDVMVAQAIVLSKWAPNIVVKLPATKAGIRAYERCVEMGINVAATVSFTVPQVLAVGAAAERGKKAAASKGITPGLTIAVMMVGRLDDYLRDVAHDNYPHVTENDIRQAGTACFKKAYSLFAQRGYDTFLMPAGCRGAYHITELAGARMIASIAPKIAEFLEDVNVFEERIDLPVEPGTVERLSSMAEFRKAYFEDGMDAREFITFGSTNRTTDQFINSGWNPLISYRI